MIRSHGHDPEKIRSASPSSVRLHGHHLTQGARQPETTVREASAWWKPQELPLKSPVENPRKNWLV